MHFACNNTLIIAHTFQLNSFSSSNYGDMMICVPIILTTCVSIITCRTHRLNCRYICASIKMKLLSCNFLFLTVTARRDILRKRSEFVYILTHAQWHSTCIFGSAFTTFGRLKCCAKKCVLRKYISMEYVYAIVTEFYRYRLYELSGLCFV